MGSLPAPANWPGFVCQGVLEAVFPDWANSDKWLERTLCALASGTAKDAVSLRRGDIKVAAFLDKFGLLLSVEGVELEAATDDALPPAYSP